MPSAISAATDERAPGPESLDGSSGSRAAIGVRVTGGPPLSCDSTAAVVENAPSGTAFDGSVRISILLGSSLSSNFSDALATTTGTPTIAVVPLAWALVALGRTALATT